MEIRIYRQYLYYAAGIGSVASLLYSIGFWGSFNFNAFEYLSFSDLISHGVQPLALALVFQILGIMFSNIFVGPNLPVGGGAQTRIGRFGTRHWKGMLFFYTVAVYIILKYMPNEIKPGIGPILFATYAIPLSHINLFIEFFPNPNIRHMALMASIYLPCLSFFSGYAEARVCMHGAKKQIVDIERTKILFRGDAGSPVVSLGFLSGSHIFYETKTGNIVIVKQNDAVPIFLKQNIK